MGQTPLSWTEHSFQCHFLFFPSCASWPRLLPLLFYLQHYLLSILLTRRDNRSRDAASLVCAQKLFLRSLLGDLTIMDGDVLSLSSSTSSVSAAAGGQKDDLPKTVSSLAQGREGPKSAEELWYVLYVLHANGHT